MRILLLLFILFALNVAGQSTDVVEEKKKELLVSFDLISPFYLKRKLNTPRWRFGLVHDLNPKHKIGLTLGFGNMANSIGFLNTNQNYSLWEVRPEYYYIFNPEKKTVKYLSAEVFFLQQKQHLTTDSYRERGGVILSFREADYRRNKFGVIFKAGMLVNLNRRLGLDMYSGIGPRMRTNQYTNVINSNQDQFFEEHFRSYFRHEGSTIGVEFSLGVKLFYKIKANVNQLTRN